MSQLAFPFAAACFTLVACGACGGGEGTGNAPDAGADVHYCPPEMVARCCIDGAFQVDETCPPLALVPCACPR